jgi:hypothetical protein
MGGRHPPLPTPSASIGHWLIRPTMPMPCPYLGNCSGKFVWHALKEGLRGQGGRIGSLPLLVSISLAIE